MQVNIDSTKSCAHATSGIHVMNIEILAGAKGRIEAPHTVPNGCFFVRKKQGALQPVVKQGERIQAVHISG
jgi:hypothetical protein